MNEYKYEGEFKNGKYHGYGILIKNNKKYSGFFKNNEFDGLGTIETDKYIEKGTWKNSMRQGVFKKLCKITEKSYFIEYYKNIAITKKEAKFKFNEFYLNTVKKIEINIKPGNCIVCCENNANSVNVQCGHVIACYSCMTNNKLNLCPICRTPNKKVIRLYYSS